MSSKKNPWESDKKNDNSRRKHFNEKKSDMSSKKNPLEPDKRNDNSRKKHFNEKKSGISSEMNDWVSDKESDNSKRKPFNEKKSDKQSYTQKYYKNSPVQLPSSSKTSTYHHHTPETSDDFDNNSSNSNNKSAKGKNLTNLQEDNKHGNFQSLSAQKANFISRNISTEFSPFNKNDERNQSNAVSFSCSKTKALYKQPQQSEKFHHGNQQINFQTGAKPKNPKGSMHHNTNKLINQNLPSKSIKIEDNLTEFKMNFNFEGSKQSNQFHRNNQDSEQKSFNFPAHSKQVSSNFVDNQKPIVPSKQNSAPFTKHIKKKDDSCNKICKKEKANKGKKQRKKAIDMKKEIINPCTDNALPLLSFQSVNDEPNISFDLIHFSDDDGDDDSYSLSQQSTNLDNLINFSDDESIDVLKPPTNTDNLMNIFDNDLSQLSLEDTVTRIFSENESECDSDSAEESEESDLTSEFSIDSGILSNEPGLSIVKPDTALKESFVSVFWDIENCALPQNKSAVDFASYVRETFYEGRTEGTFTIVCDVSNLNNLIQRDIDEAAITLIHVSSLNKNAADKKIMSLLQRFQIQYRQSNSAIVLISSDSDFSQILLDMRYQHHIFINLICKSNTRDSLTRAANKFVLLEDALSSLPDRVAKNDMMHVIAVTNLPEMKVKQIKSSLSEKLKIFNCKLKFLNASMAKIYFKDHSVCLKALNSLKGFYLGEKELVFTYETELNEKEFVTDEDKKVNVDSFNIKKKEKSVSKEIIPANSKMKEEASSSKGATLCVIVSTYLNDLDYWKSAFEKMWNMIDFTIQWDDSTFGGCFLISFKSLKKAQKAKKILQKNQINDSNSPKFLKLIKHEDDLSNLKTNFNNIQEINQKKIDEYLHIIEMKKLKFLKRHENIANEIKGHASSKITGATEAVIEKLVEFNEQMVTFQTFSNIIINTIKNLNCNSENLEQQLKEILCDFTHECNCFAAALPIYTKKEDILNKIRENQVVVICAEVGSGKSTQLTQYISSDKNNFRNGKVICTQPRKISAIAHAKYLCSQIGSRLGGIVGYQVGISKKVSENTNILYVTDSIMLKILVNEGLDSISCIIIDEAQERTIYTDILLGMIKQYLPVHPQLRVVITSTSNDVSVFCDFFALSENAIVHILRRTFPVQDVWLDCDITSDWGYFFKAIDKTFEVLNEDPGDVLTFLASSAETEKACKMFIKKLKGSKAEENTNTFCLHDEMDPEELKKVLEKTPKGKRKVVFATNYAEASITIPNIKYVIDCGLMKECKYEGVKNMNIYSVDFISKSSAERRRGRAGETQVGKCYHLYSKENYKCMEPSAVPDIFKTNLSQPILKLLSMGLKNSIQFYFLQSPPKELLNSAMNQLLYLNAVDENLFLTDLGKNMAALPLEPRLCHLIFKGFDNNIGYDTLVTSAAVTMASSIFYHTSENKDKINEKRKRFCEYGSDFISYLEVYKEWADVPKTSKFQWCIANCINSHTMCIVHELINEIILILQKELKFKVKLKFNSEAMTYDTLTKLIFYSFSQNLSVFSGHLKWGYKSLNIPDRLFIHPSSSLSAFGESMPRFVVFDTILKTTRPFIINASPVTKDMILDAINLNSLKIDLKSLDDLTGTEVCISPIAEEIIVKFFVGKKGVKQKELYRKIKELTHSDFIDISIDISKQCIKIFSFCENLENKIQSIIDPIIHEAQQFLLNEERDIYIGENRQINAVLSAGGHINDIIFPGEFKDIEVILKGQESIESICEKLSLCGIITDVHTRNKKCRVVFDTNASAKKALETYKNEPGFFLRDPHKNADQTNYSYKVLMMFLRLPGTGIAYMSLHPKISASTLPSVITYESKTANVNISKKTGDMRICNLPLNANRNKLISFVSKILPSDVKISKCVVPKKKPYESTTEEMDLIRRNILKLFSQFTSKENVNIYLKKPDNKDRYWCADVYFKNSLDAETAIGSLKDCKGMKDFLGGISFKPELITFLCCKTLIFSVLKEEIEESFQIFKKNQSPGGSLSIDAIPVKSNTVKIKIMSNNVRDVIFTTRCMREILNGNELKYRTNSHKIKLFSNYGREMLRKLSLEFQDCYVLQNEYSKKVSIFGKKASCNIIKMRINEFLNDVQNDDFKELSLKTSSGNPGVFKELLRRYGYDLQKLKEYCGILDIDINRYSQVAVIRKDPLSLQKFESILQDIKEKLDANSAAEKQSEICPVCSDEVSDVKHYLKYCGHPYCYECLLYLFQYSETIPLKCEYFHNKKQCSAPVVVADIFWAIKGRKPLEKILFRRFLHAFVDRRSDISFCPTPECSMIFRVTDKMNAFSCPLCENSICTKCEDYYHFGMSCSLNELLKTNSDSSLQIWKEEDPINHKLCPSCSSPVEKNGSCNNMICWQCKRYICWLCFKTFSTANEVYAHLSKCPMNHPLMT